ncbi:MAG: hypothetical protein GY861_05840 [bacterium]|nr:hypothetical protein [bacterium]
MIHNTNDVVHEDKVREITNMRSGNVTLKFDYYKRALLLDCNYYVNGIYAATHAVTGVHSSMVAGIQATMQSVYCTMESLMGVDIKKKELRERICNDNTVYSTVSKAKVVRMGTHSYAIHDTIA